jgi:hypothetical protein
MLAEPLNKDFSLPSAGALRDQVSANWIKLDKGNSKGPFSSPQVRIFTVPDSF